MLDDYGRMLVHFQIDGVCCCLTSLRIASEVVTDEQYQKWWIASLRLKLFPGIVGEGLGNDQQVETKPMVDR